MPDGKEAAELVQLIAQVEVIVDQLGRMVDDAERAWLKMRYRSVKRRLVEVQKKLHNVIEEIERRRWE